MSDDETPAGFDALPSEQQRAILDWVRATWLPAKTSTRGTYQLKHRCEESVGFYVSEGRMIGAFRAAGFCCEQTHPAGGIVYCKRPDAAAYELRRKLAMGPGPHSPQVDASKGLPR